MYHTFYWAEKTTAISLGDLGPSNIGLVSREHEDFQPNNHLLGNKAC